MGLKETVEEEYGQGDCGRRLLATLTVEIGRGHTGDDLVDTIVERYRDDERMMEVYDQDVAAFREDVDSLVSALPETDQTNVRDLYVRNERLDWWNRYLGE